MACTAIEAQLKICNQADGRSRYHTVDIGGLNIFYREAGPSNAPTVLLLHGFPSSSRMWEPLLPLLADKYHLIAPDYPGFGNSDAPSPSGFTYTFDNLASVVDELTVKLGITNYVLFMQDYGGPVGFRLALAHPERISAIIIQNAVSHEQGLSPLWDARRKYWADPVHELEALKANFTSLEATRQRHIGSSPRPERYDPDTWTDEYAFLSRPGQADIQATLFLDYRTNVASYPRWQKWLRETRPPTLVVWGKYDPSFAVAGAKAYARRCARSRGPHPRSRPFRARRSDRRYCGVRSQLPRASKSTRRMMLSRGD